MKKLMKQSRPPSATNLRRYSLKQSEPHSFNRTLQSTIQPIRSLIPKRLKEKLKQFETLNLFIQKQIEKNNQIMNVAQDSISSLKKLGIRRLRKVKDSPETEECSQFQNTLSNQISKTELQIHKIKIKFRNRQQQKSKQHILFRGRSSTHFRSVKRNQSQLIVSGSSMPFYQILVIPA